MNYSRTLSSQTLHLHLNLTPFWPSCCNIEVRRDCSHMRGTLTCFTSWMLASWRSCFKVSAARAFGRMTNASPCARHQYLRCHLARVSRTVTAHSRFMRVCTEATCHLSQHPQNSQHDTKIVPQAWPNAVLAGSSHIKFHAEMRMCLCISTLAQHDLLLRHPGVGCGLAERNAHVSG